MVDVSELVSQMHETLSSIHEIISSLSVKDHESKLDELEQRQETALAALHSVFERESRSDAEKRQAQLAEIAEQRRLEDEEREAKRLHEDDELKAQLAQQDKDRQAKLEREEIEIEKSTDAMIATVEEAAKQVMEEGKVKLTVLEEKRRELNRRIDEQLQIPLPALPTRRKLRGRASVSTVVAGEPNDRSIDDKEDTEASTETVVPKMEGAPGNSNIGKSIEEGISVLPPIPSEAAHEMTSSEDSTTAVSGNDMQPAAQLPSPEMPPTIKLPEHVQPLDDDEHGDIANAAVSASQELPAGLDDHVAEVESPEVHRHEAPEQHEIEQEPVLVSSPQLDHEFHEVQKNTTEHTAVEAAKPVEVRDDEFVHNAQIPAELLNSEASPISANIDHANDDVAQSLSDDHLAAAVVEEQRVPEIVVTGVSAETVHEATNFAVDTVIRSNETDNTNDDSSEEDPETHAEREPVHHVDLHENKDRYETHDSTIAPDVISEEHGVPRASILVDDISMAEDYQDHFSAYGQAMQTELSSDYVDYGASYYASAAQQSIYLPPVLHEATSAPTESLVNEIAQRIPVQDVVAKLGQDVMSEDDYEETTGYGNDTTTVVSEHSLSYELDKFPQTPTSIIAAPYDEEPESPSAQETGEKQEGQQGPAPGEIASYDDHMPEVVPPRVEHGEPTAPTTPPRQLPGRAEWETPAYSDSDAEETAVFAPRDVTNKSWRGSGIEATPGSVHSETTMTASLSNSRSSTPESAPHDEPLPVGRGQPLAKLDHGHVVAVDEKGFAIEAVSIADEQLQPRTSERPPSMLTRSRPTSLASTNLFQKMRSMFESPEAGSIPSKRDSTSSSTSQLSTPRLKQMPQALGAETANAFEDGVEADDEDSEADDVISERRSLLQAASINTSANNY